jgi:hypothetical protein
MDVDVIWYEYYGIGSQAEFVLHTSQHSFKAPESGGKLEVLQLTRVTISPSHPYITQLTTSTLMLLS